MRNTIVKKLRRLVCAVLVIALCLLTLGCGKEEGGYSAYKPKSSSRLETVDKVDPKDNTMDKPCPDNDGRFVLSGEPKDYVFGSDYRAEQILTITFLDTLRDAPPDAIDVSEADNGMVWAWFEQSSGNPDLYDLYIGADGGVWAPEDSKRLFIQFMELTEISFNGAFHTEYVTDMSLMFHTCPQLTTLDVSDFDTSKVKDMGGMFINCGSLVSLDLSSFDTRRVTDMGYMFADCGSLKTLDLSSFDTSNVTDMKLMFNGCGRLSDVPIGNFDTSKVDTSDGDFFGYFMPEKCTINGKPWRSYFE